MPKESDISALRLRIAFVLPASYTLANAPRPTDPRVTLAEVPPRRMAVVRYRGTWSKARYGEELAALTSRCPPLAADVVTTESRPS